MSPRLHCLLSLCLALAGGAPASAALPDGLSAAGKYAPRTDRHGDPLPEGALARLGTERLRHAGLVREVFFSADGKRLVSAGAEGTVRVWDAQTGRALSRFPIPPASHLPGPDWGAVSPDGKILVTRDEAFHFWDVDAGRELPWSPARQGIREKLNGATAAFSDDGKRLLVMGQKVSPTDGEQVPRLVCWVYDIAAGKLLRRVTVPLRTVWGMGMVPPFALLPDGRVLVGEGDGGRLTVREAGVEKPVLDLKGALFPSAFSPDGKLGLAVDQQGLGLAVVEVDTGKVRYRIAGHNSARPILSGDGRRGVGQSAKLAFQVWGTATGKILRQFPSKGTGLAVFALSRDGGLFAVADADGGVRLKVWEVRTGKAILNVPLPALARCLTFSPDGRRLAAGVGPTVQLWNLETGRRMPTPAGHELEPGSLAFSRDGKRLASIDASATTILWELPTARAKSRFAAPTQERFVNSLFWDGDGRLLAVGQQIGYPSPPEVGHVWEPLTGKRRFGFAPTEGVVTLAVAPDGRSLAVAHPERVCLWDVETGRRTLNLPVERVPAFPNPPVPLPPGSEKKIPLYPLHAAGLCLSRDGRLLAGLCTIQLPGFNTVRLPLWETATGKQRGRLKWDVGQPGGHVPHRGVGPVITDFPGGVELTPDARAAAVSGKENIRLIRLKDGVEIRRFGGVEIEPRTVRFSPDGELLAAVTADGALRLWDVATGTALAGLQSAPGRVTRFAFSPDGKTLATGLSDTTILLWEVERLRAAPRKPAGSLTAQRLETLWADLAAEDGHKASRAIHALEESPREAGRFLKAWVRPVAPLEPARLKRLLADLGSGKYADREKAKRELQALGELALPALRALHKAAPALDVERQAKWLLDRMEGPVRYPETVRLLRAVEVLERLGTAEAREALTALARGAPEARVTREARASLRRLQGAAAKTD
jgi:WD40 repeat protein